MSPGATFERVYLALKAQIGSGVMEPGAQLEPAALSATLASSITPVRDALHRLAGERLVQTPRGDGFRIPIFTEAALRDLYGWNLRLLLLATQAAKPRVQGQQEQLEPLSDPVAETERLFLAIAHRAASAEHVTAIANNNDRLRAIRNRETATFDQQEELAAIREALAANARPLLRRELATYHRRRVQAVSRLVETIQPLG